MPSVTRLERGAPNLRDANLAHLERLAITLAEHGMTAHVSQPPGRLPWLAVSYPDGGSQDVYAWLCEDRNWWFWWPWAQRIAAAGDLTEAAAVIERELKGTVPAGDGA